MALGDAVEYALADPEPATAAAPANPQLTPPPPAPPRSRGPGGLTAREVEVVRLVAAGKTNRAIAAALVLSEHTVARHLNHIYAKLGVGSRVEAAAFALRAGLAAPAPHTP
jgi:DNA-binding NarL/FixJ family response regulator